jgi:hypothetical protein
MFIVVDCWSRTIDRSLLIRVLIVTRYPIEYGGRIFWGQSRLDLQDTFDLFRTQRIDHGKIGFINAALD